MSAARRCARVLALAALLVPAAVVRVGAQPTNDTCSGARVIDTVPFEDQVDLSGATLDPGETFPCDFVDRTLWYRLESPTPGSVCVQVCSPFYSVTTMEFLRGTCASAVEISCQAATFDPTPCTGQVVDVSPGAPVLIHLGTVFPLPGTSLSVTGVVDSDGDGIPDCQDACPDIPNDRDTDGDGVPDCFDSCPEIPNDLDTDGDGIPDCVDPCPDIPTDRDTDGDGIPDCIDSCPTIDNRIDQDGDGVPDCLDRCPTVPGRDADGDGIQDCLDNCLLVFNPDQDDTDGDGTGDACQQLPTQFRLRRTLQKETPAAGDQLGFAVTFANFDALVGAPFDDPGGATDAGSALLFDGETGTRKVVLQKQTPAAGDRFGSAVASLSGVPLIGAPFDDTAGPENAGQVYVYLLGQLLPATHPTPRAGEQVGFALASDGQVVAAGAPGDDEHGTGAGRAFVAHVAFFVPPQVTVTPVPGTVAGAQFGSAVAVASVAGHEYVVVGAPFDDGGSGAAYVYDGEGHLLATLHNPDPAPGDLFGAALAMVAGNAVNQPNVVVGAPFDDTMGTDAGSAYVFSLAGDLRGALHQPHPAPGDLFGAALAGIVTSNGTNVSVVAVGAPGDDTGAEDAGAVYLMGAIPGSQSFGKVLQVLPNPTPAPGDRFGFAVSDDSTFTVTRVLVGAPGDDRGAPDAGIAYQFEFCGDQCPTGCGNGILEPGEECDDGNTASGDGCDANCTVTRCGNRVVTAGEGCDDGNTTSGDGCDASCLPEGCGTSVAPVAPPGGVPAPGCVATCSCRDDNGKCCDDGNPCTGHDTCVFGVCRGTPVDCDDGLACTVDSCDASGTCVHVPDDAACDDGALCTTDECRPGAGCVHTSIPGCCRADADCEDADTCDGTEQCRACVGCFLHDWACCGRGSTCVAGTPLSDGVPCSDENVCTVADTCRGGHCAAGAPRSCDDGDPCTVDTCHAPLAGCEETLRPGCRACTAGCDDGNPCNGVESCDGVYCTAGTALDCDDGDPCTADTCAPATGCSHAVSAGPLQCALREALARASCDGARVPQGLTRHFQRATALADSAASATGRSRKRLAAKARSEVARARAAVSGAVGGRRMSRACGGDVRAALTRVTSRLQELTP